MTGDGGDLELPSAGAAGGAVRVGKVTDAELQEYMERRIQFMKEQAENVVNVLEKEIEIVPSPLVQVPVLNVYKEKPRQIVGGGRKRMTHGRPTGASRPSKKPHP